MLYKNILFFESKTILSILSEITGIEETKINLSFISQKAES